MIASAELKWLAKVAITSVVALTLCLAAPRFFPAIPDVQPFTSTDQATDAIIRYRSSPVHDVVLAGSSLTYRLKEEYFDGGNVRNAALPGDSPVTGLRIIAGSTMLPKVAAVETNILSRSVNEALLAKYEFESDSPRVGFRPVRAAVAASIEFSRRQATSDPASILASPPLSHLSSDEVRRQRELWDKDDFQNKMVTVALALKQNIEQLETRGVRVYLFHLPYMQELENSKYAEDARRALGEVFGANDRRWLDVRYPVAELRWSDGTHLDQRSAVMVAHSLQRAIADADHPSVPSR
jgi:hypothetical protein